MIRVSEGSYVDSHLTFGFVGGVACFKMRFINFVSLLFNKGGTNCFLIYLELLSDLIFFLNINQFLKITILRRNFKCRAC